MGLPDPVAFAMLVALGAIPDPMALLNEMMATPNEEEEKAAFWKSGQVPLATAEASDSAELERLAKQVSMSRGWLVVGWTLRGGDQNISKHFRQKKKSSGFRASEFFMWFFILDSPPNEKMNVGASKRDVFPFSTFARCFIKC